MEMSRHEPARYRTGLDLDSLHGTSIATSRPRLENWCRGDVPNQRGVPSPLSSEAYPGTGHCVARHKTIVEIRVVVILMIDPAKEHSGLFPKINNGANTVTETSLFENWCHRDIVSPAGRAASLSHRA